MEDTLYSASITMSELKRNKEYITDVLLPTAKNGRSESKMISNNKGAVADHTKQMAKQLRDLITIGQFEEEENLPTEVRDFIIYFDNLNNSDAFDITDKSDITIAKDYEHIASIAEFFYKLPNNSKRKLAEESFNYWNETNDLAVWNDSMAIMYHSLGEFDAVYKYAINETDIVDIPSVDQKMAAFYVSAHMNSELANVAREIRPSERDVDNLLAIYGIGGSGKSTLVMSLGLKIGQHFQAKSHSEEDTGILLASNHKDQIDIIYESADNSSVRNVRQINGKHGVNLEELISLTESEKSLDGVSTIVYDEATFIPKGELTDNYNEKSALDKLIFNVKKINKSRSKNNKAPLRLIFMGDPEQNGYTSKSGSTDNIGDVPSILSPNKMNISFRAKVQPLNSLLKDIKDIPHNLEGGTPGVTNLKSEYGLINGDEELDLLGGVRFLKPAEALTDILANAADHMDDSAKTGDRFKVAIVTDDEITNSELQEFIDKYPNNVKVYTHKGVQGQEVDYVIGYINENTFGNRVGKAYEEAAKGKMLSTTISRAKYFAVMINETNRVFESKKSDTVTMTNIEYRARLSEAMLELYNIMITRSEEMAISEAEPKIVLTEKEQQQKEAEDTIKSINDEVDSAVKDLRDKKSKRVKSITGISEEEAAETIYDTEEKFNKEIDKIIEKRIEVIGNIFLCFFSANLERFC